MIKVILPLILVTVALAVIGPFLTIWALNTVFPVLAIPYTMETWAAIILLGGLFKVSFRS
jgi:hypothetical protein